MVDIRRILGLCLVGAAPAWAAITNVRVIGTTPVSAVLGYTAPDYGACSVSISEYSDLLPLVHDVNPALFPGADQDSRTGSVTTGRNRVFVAGQGTTATASDSRRYSRALQTNTLHYYKITCGSDTATGTFQTANIALGRTHSEAIQADAREPGAYLQPTVGYNASHTGTVNTSGTAVTLVSGHNFNPNWRRGATITINGVDFPLTGVNSPTQLTLQVSAGSQTGVSYRASDRDERIIDPSSGALLRHVSLPQDQLEDGNYLNQTFTAAAGSGWTNPANILAQDGAYATYSGSGQDILTLTITPYMYNNMSLDAIRLHLYGRAEGGSVDDRSVEACIDINNDALCDTDWQEVALGTANGDSYIGTSYPIDTWRNPDHYIYPLAYSDVKGNTNFRILLKKKTTATNTLYLDSVKLDVYGSNKIVTPDGGFMEMCSTHLSANGYYHCVGKTPGSDSVLYAFEPNSGEARFLGRLRTTVGGLSRRFGPDDAGWDVSNPDVFYATAISNSGTLYKCTLTGNDTPVSQNANASMSCTDLLAGQTLGDRIYAFDNSFNSSLFSCFLSGVQNQYGVGVCRRGGQDTYGWLFVVDLTSGPPVNVIGAVATYAAPRTRWSGIHVYDYPGHQNAAPIILSFLTVGGSYLGPYTVSLQTPMNATDSQSTITVTSTWNSAWGTAPSGYHPGEPLSQYDDHFLQTLEVGDTIKIGGEWVKVLAKAYPDADHVQLTVSRGYLGTTKATHAIGDAGTMVYDCGIAGNAEAIWKFLLDPHGTDTTNTYFVADPYAGAHMTRRLNRKFEAGMPMTLERSQTEITTDAPSVLERVNIETSPEFAHKFADGNANQWQAHPTYHQVKAPPQELEWGLDSHPLNYYASSPTITLQSGTTGVYKLSATLNPKHFETVAFCGYKPLRDISSAATGDTITDSTPYTRCLANAANECRTGSVAGDAFVSCPGLSSPTGCSLSANSICLADWPFNGYNIVQWGFGSNHEGSRASVAPAAYGGGYSRVLGRGGATRYQTLYWNTRALAYGDWAWAEFDAVERPDMWFLKIPPFPTKDSVSRTTFVPVPVKLGPPAGLAVNNAVVEFGYDSGFRCTSRNESCFANTASINEANPFVWPSDVGGETSISGLACTSGCSVSIPALSQKVLYYRWKYRDAGNVTLATGATQVYVVP